MDPLGLLRLRFYLWERDRSWGAQGQDGEESELVAVVVAMLRQIPHSFLLLLAVIT